MALPSTARRWTAIALLATLPAWGAAADEPLAVAVARGAGTAGASAYDGVVEAVRQTTLAAQVSGAIVQLAVKAGDRVSAGQLLLRIDARAADQGAAASEAQVRAARAAQDIASKAFERQRQLYDANFISASAFERAEAEHRAATAQADAQIAQAGAARTQSALHVVRAPYAGIVSDVPVTLGDMALPGRPLLTLYDPAALRVSAAVPQSAATPAAPAAAVRIELPLLPAAQRMQAPRDVQWLPAADAATHTVTVRAELATGPVGLAPGQFARLWLPGAAPSGAKAWVPAASVVRRAEMTAIYVIDDQGRPQLRQVRTGRRVGDEVEVLAGLSPGERVAADPQAAARIR
jgi:RND family efflux transporter MFP subunit